jgi:hypothetical protein
METVKLTIRLPKADVEFAKQYAKVHGITVTELVDRYFRQLQAILDIPEQTIHPEVEKITGILPPEVNVQTEYGDYLERKHSCRS